MIDDKLSNMHIINIKCDLKSLDKTKAMKLELSLL